MISIFDMFQMTVEFIRFFLFFLIKFSVPLGTEHLSGVKISIQELDLSTFDWIYTWIEKFNDLVDFVLSRKFFSKPKVFIFSKPNESKNNESYEK